MVQTQDDHMEIAMFGMTMIGLYPLENANFLRKTIHKIYGKLLFGYFLYCITAQYIELYMSLGTLSFDILEILIICLLYTTTTVKISTVLNKRMNNLLDQIRKTEQILLNDDDHELRKIHTKYKIYNDKLGKFIYWVGFVTLLPFVVQPYFELLAFRYSSPPNVTWERTLPFRSWFPFDRRKYYPVAYGMHVLFGSIGASFTVITDAFIWGNIIYITAQCKILQYKLRNFRQHAALLVKNNPNMNQEIADRMCVKKCAIIHKLIIAFTEKLNSCTNILMLMDFMICSIQMGVSGIRIIVKNEVGFPLIAAIEFMMAMLVQMMLFYWHANEMTLESSAITMAIWESEWYHSSDDVKKSLNFMTLRAQKPLVLNIGPFYPMSTTTAISLLRGAYSYVALMRQMY